MRKLAAVLAIAVVAVLLPTTSGANTADCEQVYVDSWDVKVAVRDKVVRRGDKAQLAMTVTRRSTGAVVSNATAAVMILDERDHSFFGVGETDDSGRVSFRIPLPRRKASPGAATVWGYAYTRHVDTVCATFAEYGFKKVPRAFRIKH